MGREMVRHSFRRFPFGLIGFLALLTLVERFVAREEFAFSGYSPTAWKYSSRKSREQGPRATILCFGSSIIKFGVLPGGIEHRTGRSSYNLAVYGGRMASSYYLFARTLDAGAKPRAVVVDCHEGPVPRDERDEQNEAIRLNLRNWPELLTLGECLDLSWNAGDGHFFASTAVARLLPSARSRHEIRDRLRDALQSRKVSPEEALVPLVRNWNRNRGSQVMPTRVAAIDPADSVPVGPEGTLGDLTPGRWCENPLLEKYARRFLGLAASRKVTVFLVLPPLNRAAQDAQDRAGFSRFFTRFARRLQAEFSNLVVVDGRRSRYPPNAFHDQTHLNASGAVALSDDLGEVIARHLERPASSPRWLSLPPYKNRPPHFPIEDFDQSTAAVRSGMPDGLKDHVRGSLRIHRGGR